MKYFPKTVCMENYKKKKLYVTSKMEDSAYTNVIFHLDTILFHFCLVFRTFFQYSKSYLTFLAVTANLFIFLMQKYFLFCEVLAIFY